MIKDAKGRKWLLRFRQYQNGWHWQAQFESSGSGFIQRAIKTFKTKALAEANARKVIQGSDVVAESKRRVEQLTGDHNAKQAKFLARPITAKMVAEYTDLIKRRKLYEGACELSWQRYFEYVAAHPEIKLTKDDRKYAGLWTGYATAKS